MRIIIGADIVPTKSNMFLFENSDLEHLIGNDLLGLFNKADYRIFNCESPITDVINPIVKSGPSISAPSKTANGFKSLRVDLMTLANNHILDQGASGLNTTIEELNARGINYVGAGKDITEAKSLFVFEIENKRVGVYACCESEFSVATNTISGANPFDALTSFDEVKSLKEKTDYVIVLYHGGREHYRYPSPNLKKVCEKFVDSGADLVVTQHSHCIGCEEKYKEKTIVYGQGNFLFDLKDNQYWATGLLIEIDNLKTIKYHPVVKKQNTVRLADENTAADILKGFEERSEQIKKDSFVEQKYHEMSQHELDRYLLILSGKNTNSIFFKAVNKITKGKWGHHCAQRAYAGDRCAYVLNLMRCEAHKEAIISGLTDAVSTKRPR